MKNMNSNTSHMLDGLQALGITYADAAALRRISMTLHRWYEAECGDSNNYTSWVIERDPETDKPYRVTYPNSGKGKCEQTPIPDKEKGAIKRLQAIMANYPLLTHYLQTDPRGASLYIVPRSSIPKGRTLDEFYRNGIAVYK